MSGGGLYDWRLHPIGGGAPFPDPTRQPLIGKVLCLADPPASPGVARIWVVGPATAVTHVSPRILGELVPALDEGLLIAILGDNADRVRVAAATVLRMAGGSHA